MDDIFFMKKALALAAGAEGQTLPNPMVGAVIVKNSIIIGEGCHRGKGRAHAEIEAISNARAGGADTAGSTMYVTLEPCASTWEGKMTPPCAPEIASAGIRRVVIASVDPNPRVCGSGIRLLESRGIIVDTGLLADEEKSLNEAWHHYMTAKRPFVHLKIAQSLDGKIADTEGASRWISGECSRRLVHRWRSSHSAVMTGIGTVLSDDPLLTVRDVPGKQPDVIIADTWLRFPASGRLAGTADSRKIHIFHREDANTGEKARQLEDMGLTLHACETDSRGKLALQAVLEKSALFGTVSILCEGGHRLASSLLECHLVDRISVFLAPRIMGPGFTFSDTLAPAGIKGKAAVLTDRVEKSGKDILVSGRCVCLQD